MGGQVEALAFQPVATYGMRMVRRAGSALAVVCVLVLAACSDDEPGQATHPLLDDTPTTAEPTTTEEALASTPPPTDEAGLPQECSDVISAVEVANIVSAPMPGIRRVYQNDFPADSGRLERLTCSYGVEAGNGRGADNQADDEPTLRDRPVAEFAISSYVDSSAAEVRVDDTVGSARLRGENVEEIEIVGRPVFVLPGDEAISYVLADKDRTYVVTLARDVVPEPAEQVILVSLVEELLRTRAVS